MYKRQDIHGCRDSQACNYDADANIDNNSCWYVGEGCTCEDEEDSEIDNCGVCDADTSNDCFQDECGVWGVDGIYEDKVILWGQCYNIEDTTGLSFYADGLTGEIPPEIGNLTNLTYLNISVNQLIGEIPEEIGNLTNLTYLRLNDNQLTGEIPLSIGNLTNLEELYLYNNELTGDIPEEVCDLIESNDLNIYEILEGNDDLINTCLLYTSPSPRD